MWHGVENTLVDLAMRPEFMHKLISRLTDIKLAMLDRLEEGSLLEKHQNIVHCSGAHTDELPRQNDKAPGTAAANLWTAGMSQIFGSVSPEMHEEFDMAYSVRWYERFGLVYYGCCEPLHNKLDIVKKIPNLRKISMSPWAYQEVGAEKIGSDYVFIRKPSPAFLAESGFDPVFIKEDLKKTIDICRRFNCPLEFNLKDISTVKYEPQRLWQWEKILMELVENQ